MRKSLRKSFWKKITIILISFALLIVGLHYFFLQRNSAKTERYLKKFTYVPELHSFVTTKSQFYTPKKPFPRMVLLLHGYSGSPEEFQHLQRALEQAHIPYYAPQLTGFGIADLHLLTVVEPSDWIRDAISAYDLAASLADRVDVLGNSTGGVLAVLVAEHRNVHTLILSAPNIASSPSDILYKKLLDTPLISQGLEYILPVFVKSTRPGRITNMDTLNNTTALHAFHYPALPTHSLAAHWQLQDEINLNKMRYKKLFLLYGQYDSTVNIAKAKQELSAAGLRYQSIEYHNSAHNIFEDNDYAKAVADTLNILKTS